MSLNKVTHQLYSATTIGQEPLEVLHLQLGHASEKVIKRLIKDNIVTGLPYTFGQIKNHKLKMCSACMKGRMKGFPTPPSRSNRKFEIFELITVDIIPVMQYCIRKYKYITLFVDKATSFTIPKLMKAKTDLLSGLKEVLPHLVLQGTQNQRI
jgi:hypothetical protein